MAERRWRTMNAARAGGESRARLSVSTRVHRGVIPITRNGSPTWRTMGRRPGVTDPDKSTPHRTVAAPDSRIESGALTGELSR